MISMIREDFGKKGAFCRTCQRDVDSHLSRGFWYGCCTRTRICHETKNREYRGVPRAWTHSLFRLLGIFLRFLVVTYEEVMPLPQPCVRTRVVIPKANAPFAE